MVGRMCIKQALYYVWGLSVPQVAMITGVSVRTAWNHIHATKSSQARAWHKRKFDEKQRAIWQSSDEAQQFFVKVATHNFDVQYWDNVLRSAHIL